MAMEMRDLGATGLVVSRVGLGLAALGRPGYINLGHGDDLAGGREVGAMEARARAVLGEAWGAGVRYFDAARSYGKAEEFLALWLDAREIAPDEAVIGSKWGYTYTAGWKVEAERHEVKDHSLANLLRQEAETRAILGAHLDLYQIHSATPESGVLDDRAVLDMLACLRASGLKVGLSLSGPRQGETLRKALSVEVDGVRPFDCVQATWNLLEPSAGPALADAHAQGLGVILKEVLANGRLTPRNLDPTFAASRRLLDAEASRLGTTVDALSLAAALALPWADVILSGAATPDQLRSNLAALDLPRDELPSLLERLAPLAEPPDEYWANRSRMPWN